MLILINSWMRFSVGNPDLRVMEVEKDYCREVKGNPLTDGERVPRPP